MRPAEGVWWASGTETSAGACSAASASSTGTAWARKRLCLTSTACVAAVASVCRITGVWSLRQQRAQVLGQLGLRIAALVFAQAFARGIGLAFGEQLRSDEHTSALQSLMRISYAVFCLKKK